MTGRTFVVCASAVLLASCSTRVVTRHVTQPLTTVAAEEGIHYFLPKTLVRASVPVTETTKSPGLYAGLAPYFFPDIPPGSIITTESKTYSIDSDSVQIATHGIKDLTQQYVLRPKGRMFADTKFHFVLSNQGVPDQINASIEDHSVDVALAVLEGGASIAKTLFVPPPPPLAATATKKADGEPSLATCPDKTVDPDAYNAIPPGLQPLYCHLHPDDRVEVFTSREDYATVLASFLNTELNDANPSAALRTDATRKKVALFLGARRLYRELVEIQGAEGKILNRDLANTSDAALKALMERRQARVKVILSNFLGTAKSEVVWAGEFDFEPSPPVANATVSRVSLFSMKSDKGICKVFSENEALTLVSAAPELASDCGKEVAVIQLSAVPTEPPLQAMNSSGGESGLRYRIPRTAGIIISESGSELKRTTAAIAQFGQIASLPQKVGGQKTQYDVVFDSATGALLDINVGGAGTVDADLVKRASAIAESGIETKQNRDAQRAPKSALEKAEAERKLKQEQLRTLLLTNCLNDPTQAGCADLVK